MLNNWNEKEVKRAETTWGNSFPQYTLDMFGFAINNGKSYLDLGCGFGRFLQFLNENVEDPNYIGYDSSDHMLARIRAHFPEYSISTYLKNITDPIDHRQDVIISSAVFVHITLEDQQKILSNILSIRPKAFTFDINSPNEGTIDRLNSEQTNSYERQIKTTKDGTSTFRMTWQSHYAMTRYILTQFKDYNLTTSFYSLRGNQHKVVYMLKRK